MLIASFARYCAAKGVCGKSVTAAEGELTPGIRRRIHLRGRRDKGKSPRVVLTVQGE